MAFTHFSLLMRGWPPNCRTSFRIHMPYFRSLGYPDTAGVSMPRHPRSPHSTTNFQANTGYDSEEWVIFCSNLYVCEDQWIGPSWVAFTLNREKLREPGKGVAWFFLNSLISLSSFPPWSKDLDKRGQCKIPPNPGWLCARKCTQAGYVPERLRA